MQHTKPLIQIEYLKNYSQEKQAVLPKYHRNTKPKRMSNRKSETMTQPNTITIYTNPANVVDVGLRTLRQRINTANYSMRVFFIIIKMLNLFYQKTKILSNIFYFS